MNFLLLFLFVSILKILVFHRNNLFFSFFGHKVVTGLSFSFSVCRICSDVPSFVPDNL